MRRLVLFVIALVAVTGCADSALSDTALAPESGLAAIDDPEINPDGTPQLNSPRQTSR
jgi:hypothetical protein